MAKKKKPVDDRIDGLNPKDVAQVRTALRRVWSWSYPRRLAVKRAINPEGFSVCEKCGVVAPKLQVDHIVPCGAVTDPGFIERLYCSSKGLQMLCKKCHTAKTKKDRAKGFK